LVEHPFDHGSIESTPDADVKSHTEPKKLSEQRRSP